MKVVNENVEEQELLSKEELTQRREEITKFYTENLKHLRVQKEYEELLMSIEEARAKRIQAQMFLAQAYASQDPNDKANDFKKANADLEDDLPKQN